MTLSAWPGRMNGIKTDSRLSIRRFISCLAELDPVWPKIPQHARAFFAAERELANYLLTTRGARTSE
jgi:hypothetical protein